MTLFLVSGGGNLTFEGWLLKMNGKVFPNVLIALESYKCTPDQIMDLDPYRDGSGELHRNVLPHTATSIEFSTTHLRLRDADRLNGFVPHGVRVKCEIEYWNPNTSSYKAGTFYISDIPYEIVNVDEKRKDILYKPIKITLTEY
jgi:hypothetical protein